MVRSQELAVCFIWFGEELQVMIWSQELAVWLLGLGKIYIYTVGHDLVLRTCCLVYWFGEKKNRS